MSKHAQIPAYSSFPLGFRTSSLAVGIKRSAKKRDLALIMSDHPCNVAAVFTQNKFRAAPVLVSQQLLSEGRPIQSLIVNSGCANACTGQQGMDDAWQAVDAIHSLTNSYPLVMSTGVIGQPLPQEKIIPNLPELCKSITSSLEAWTDTARAFMTTDTFPKLRVRETTVKGKSFRILGISKGAGMIHPNMATLLGCFVTDAHVPQDVLQSCLSSISELTFNRISIDSDTSTNDTVCILSNTQSPVLTDDELVSFKRSLHLIARDLAKLVVRDAEGATKFLTVQTRNGPSQQVSLDVCRAICSSPLVKTAMYGKDANWGRIVAKVGSVEGDFSIENVHVYLMDGELDDTAGDDEDAGGGDYDPNSLHLIQNGSPYEIDEAVASKILEGTDVSIVIDLGCEGGFTETMWTSDLTKEYVAINADYRT